ncbi:MCE family protein [Mycobacterium intracellulare]|uniref:MCE family protein n=1 Tax=Mycobacterium intracellulare TaxID=1767 RepID=UPI00080BB82E|nr:MCE family protein [Mycobacterium intracellulare]OCB22546.1 MCE-family protein MCE3A [Mycobacterium intracellulare subsp. yongonense]
MNSSKGTSRVHPLWWTAGMFLIIIALVLLCSALFAGTFRSYIPVTLISDRIGLVMESGAKVKMRGVEVGRVAGTTEGSGQPVGLKLEIFPDQVANIPANVAAEIKATTAFGAKYVDLVPPTDPSPKRLAAGAVLKSRNVTTEVNTVFQNLVGLLRQIDVTKLNSVLTAMADGVRGQGQRIGEATTAANHVLQAVNPRMDTVAEDWRAFGGFSDAYSAAAKDILATLDAASTTSDTITGHASALDALLMSSIGFSTSAVGLLGPMKDNFVTSVTKLAPTFDLLLKYSPTYTCTILGGKLHLDIGGNPWFGGNGRTVILDAGLAFGDDVYQYPENLPIVAAKGGPGGKPGCGSLPDVSKNFPVRQLVTNTGWGTGLDWRPNPGIGEICSVNYGPVTRAIPGPPDVGHCLPGPAPGPAPAYPGGVPYGAPWYGPDGTPLYPGVPPADPNARYPSPALGPRPGVGPLPPDPVAAPNTATPSTEAPAASPADQSPPAP